MPKVASDSRGVKNKIAELSVKQDRACINARRNRIRDIQKNEELYNGKDDRPTLKGRFNVPLPIMSGFVDTLMAKIDEPPRLRFRNTKDGGLQLAAKVEGAHKVDSSAIRGKWARKDRGTKKLAAFSGRGIYKIFAESSPKYRSVLEVVDYNDFIFDIDGGGDLDDHKYKGQINIFRTEYELLEGVEDGRYDADQVTKLIASGSEEKDKKNNEAFQKKQERIQTLGIGTISEKVTDGRTFNMVEKVLLYRGAWYYAFYEFETGVWVRVDPLEQVFGSDLSPWVSWATHEDPFNFLSKAPCDDMRPVAEAMQILFNQALDNRQARNRPQRAFDPSIFPDPAQLEYRPDGLVIATTKGGNRAISSGIYTFETPEITGTIDLVQFLDGFVGQKTGITSGAQGVSDKDTKVGVYFGDMQNVADRLGLYNKSYTEAHAQLGIRYYHGLKMHMPQKMMVQYLGEGGVEWTELSRRELHKTHEEDFEISVEGGDAEAQANEVMTRRKEDTLKDISQDETLRQKVSPTWLLENRLRAAGFTEEEIRQARDTENDGNKVILSEAARAIEDILAGDRPRENRGATTAFVRKILDYARDNDVGEEKYRVLMDYAMLHLPIAKKNAIREARSIIAKRGALQLGLPQDQPLPGGVAPGRGAEIPGEPAEPIVLPGSRAASAKATAAISPM